MKGGEFDDHSGGQLAHIRKIIGEEVIKGLEAYCAAVASHDQTESSFVNLLGLGSRRNTRHSTGRSLQSVRAAAVRRRSISSEQQSRQSRHNGDMSGTFEQPEDSEQLVKSSTVERERAHKKFNEEPQSSLKGANLQVAKKADLQGTYTHFEEPSFVHNMGKTSKKELMNASSCEIENPPGLDKPSESPRHIPLDSHMMVPGASKGGLFSCNACCSSVMGKPING